MNQPDCRFRGLNCVLIAATRIGWPLIISSVGVITIVGRDFGWPFASRTGLPSGPSRNTQRTEPLCRLAALGRFLAINPSHMALEIGQPTE